MARIKYTKNELKKQKESLQRFERYLPTLLLKKQQLQTEIRKIKVKEEKLKQDYDSITATLMRWIEVFGEAIDMKQFINIKELNMEEGNIAGIDIPLFADINIEEVPYDLFSIPLWVDRALVLLKKLISIRAERDIIEQDLLLLSEELRITSQRVNLFEKVKIPEAKENIRVIKIYLGDQQIAAVVRGKIAKNKIRREAG
jgi:V/A-type H+-transporting ATPase subunit D